MEEMLSPLIPRVVQLSLRQGEMSAAYAIPAVSGGLMLVGVVMQAFVLLELEGGTFKACVLNMLLKSFQTEK